MPPEKKRPQLNMADAFFEQWGTGGVGCFHLNNDGISCNDCFEILQHYSCRDVSDRTSMIPVRYGGKTIRAEDLHGLQVPFPVLTRARVLFEKVTRRAIFRGPTRLGIIVGCLLFAYKLEGCFATSHDILTHIKIKNINCLEGIIIIDKVLYEYDRDQYNELTAINLTFAEAAHQLAKKLGIPIPPTFDKWACFVNKHCRISTAAAVAVWLYIREMTLSVTLEQLALAANLSINTIKKVCTAPVI